jgi:UDP-glucose 4-epimerase
VENVVEANLLAVKAPAAQAAGRVFNIATGTSVDLNETFQVLKKLTGYKLEARYGPERAGDVKHSAADTTLAETQLGFKARIDFEEGLRRTIDWYREQGMELRAKS